MTLREQRCLFTRLLASLIKHAFELGYEVSLEEVMRSKVQAQANSASGAGISNSLHTIGLAADMNLYINGDWQQSSEAHRQLGAYWKSLHKLARWGGDFRDSQGRPKSDGNHYSLEWQGRK